MQIKQCDRCEKLIEANQIGVVLDMYKIRVTRGSIKANNTMARLLKENGDSEYLPIVFSEDTARNVELCTPCFDEFMKFS